MYTLILLLEQPYCSKINHLPVLMVTYLYKDMIVLMNNFKTIFDND